MPREARAALMRPSTTLAISSLLSLLAGFACHVMIDESAEPTKRNYQYKIGRVIGAMLGVVLLIYAFQYLIYDFGNFADVSSFK
jgi:hypothetical protein